MTNTSEGSRLARGYRITESGAVNLTVAVPSLRPVNELEAAPETVELARLRGIAMDPELSRFGGSRGGTQTNVHALDTLRHGQTQQLLDTLGLLRQEVVGEDAPEAVTDLDIRRLSDVGVGIAAYVMMRRRNPLGIRLPEFIGNTFKAAAGFRLLANYGIVGEDIHTYHTAADVTARAEETGVYVNRSKSRLSCPANDALITLTADALLFGNGAKPEESELPKYLTEGEFKTLIDFSEPYGSYLLLADKLRLGLRPPRAIWDMTRWQRECNTALGRNPDDVPAPTDYVIDTLAAGDLVASKGGLVYQALHEVKGEIEDLTAAQTLTFRPMERRGNPGIRQKKNKKKKR